MKKSKGIRQQEDKSNRKQRKREREDNNEQATIKILQERQK